MQLVAVGRQASQREAAQARLSVNVKKEACAGAASLHDAHFKNNSNELRNSLSENSASAIHDSGVAVSPGGKFILRAESNFGSSLGSASAPDLSFRSAYRGGAEAVHEAVHAQYSQQNSSSPSWTPMRHSFEPSPVPAATPRQLSQEVKIVIRIFRLYNIVGVNIYITSERERPYALAQDAKELGQLLSQLRLLRKATHGVTKLQDGVRGSRANSSAHETHRQ
jgi:hypothetical protein